MNTIMDSAVQSPHPPVYPAADATNDGGDTVAGVQEYERLINREDNEKFEAAEQNFENKEGEEHESETEKDDEQLEKLETVSADMEEAEGERPKLADGFYEIQNVRRKRVRKGQLQYLIKWRGWPEAANTWEPVDNLLQCLDVIDAFEERLKAAKKRLTQKRKHQVGITHVQTTKKQHQRALTSASHNLPSKIVRITEDPLPSPIPNDFSSINNNRRVNDNGKSKTTASVIVEEEKEHTESNLNLCKSKRTIVPSSEETNTLIITSLEGQVAGPDMLSNKLAKADAKELVQSGRCTGARKRKSGAVKRFKKDPESYTGNNESLGVQQPDYLGNYMTCKDKVEDFKNICSISEIVKPISYKSSTSNNIGEVLVGFEAVRSDGTKVLVDNKYLKANNPLLLIDFYEKHLRCNPTQ